MKSQGSSIPDFSIDNVSCSSTRNDLDEQSAASLAAINHLQSQLDKETLVKESYP
jgi:hypothetical protein